MGRANNISRSLVIISKLQGWDPCKIEGSEYPNCDYPEDHVTKGDTGYLGGKAPVSPESSVPNVSVPGPDNRGPGAGGQSHGTHDPNAGK